VGGQAPGTPASGDELLRVAESVHAGEVSVGFFDGLPRSADVVALDDAEALVLTPAAFQRLRLTHPRLALRFVLDLGRILGERFRASDAIAGPAER
jgi:hypothetical protein